MNNNSENNNSGAPFWLCFWGVVILIIGIPIMWQFATGTCIKLGCDYECWQDSVYCVSHDPEVQRILSTPIKHYTPGTNSYSSGSGYSGGSYSKSTYSNKSSSSKKTYMPDCDDYEDFDDFMDNWDGNMPDGSDAEEYWDNW